MFDLATKYTFALDKNTSKSVGRYLLLSNLEKYLNGAIIEMNRMTRVRRLIMVNLQSQKLSKNFRLQYLANDHHFYFICVDKVYKLLSALGKEFNDKEIADLAKRVNKVFDITSVRNHLEHIDDRSLGFLSIDDKKKQNRKFISDFGNFIGDNFSFDGKKFPSDKNSVSKLKEKYIQLIAIINKKYASKDPGFVWREQSEKRYKALMKALKKAGIFQT